MQQRQIYYLQALGYTVWQTRQASTQAACDCTAALQQLSDARLLCFLDNDPVKAEKDLWLFITMAFDISQQFYLLDKQVINNQLHICFSCQQQWLQQSTHHHIISFTSRANSSHESGQCLELPSLSEMIQQPGIKKSCFLQLQQFLCQNQSFV